MLGIGQDHLTPVFPKLVFLHRYGINGKEEDRNYDLYLKSIKCISKRMYPDMLSLNKGYLGDIYDKYELAVSQMGCRAFLSPWYERGGMYPEDENDTPIFTGRANCGAITLNTVRYAIEAKGDKDKYYELLDKYFWVAIRRHLAIYDKMCKIKASSNPLFFCEGGCFLKLDPDESIERAIKTFTWSIGYIGLTEASLLMIGKELHEDNSFAIEVLEHLDKLIEEAKGKYKLLFAIYGTPAEGLCFKFRDKDFEKYGEIKGVTDKPYYMNSFHANVNAPISSFEKQDIENPMFHLSKGGRISYVEFPNTGNLEALKVSMDKAMRDGKYEGTNIELDKCRDCGFDGEFKEHKCTRCGSSNIIEIGRVCGYLSYKVLDGDTRMNKGKVAEYEDRRDHFQIPVDVEEIYNELCTDIKR